MSSQTQYHQNMAIICYVELVAHIQRDSRYRVTCSVSQWETNGTRCLCVCVCVCVDDTNGSMLMLVYSTQAHKPGEVSSARTLLNVHHQIFKPSTHFCRHPFDVCVFILWNKTAETVKFLMYCIFFHPPPKFNWSIVPTYITFLLRIMIKCLHKIKFIFSHTCLSAEKIFLMKITFFDTITKMHTTWPVNLKKKMAKRPKHFTKM